MDSVDGTVEALHYYFRDGTMETASPQQQPIGLL